MKLNNLFKNFGITALALACFLSFASKLSADGSNPNLLLIGAEIDKFLDSAEKADAETNPESKKHLVEDLIEYGYTIADKYMGLTEDVKLEVNKELLRVISENPKLNAYFIWIGNGFLHYAGQIVNKRKADESRVRTYTIAGGAVVGAVVGGVIVYFKGGQEVAKGISQYAIGVGLGAAVGAGAGWAGSGYAISAYLPADPRVDTAEKFLQKYPTGDDFMKSLGTSTVADLSMILEGIDTHLLETNW